MCKVFRLQSLCAMTYSQIWSPSSVGYAFSVAFIASVVLVTFPPSFHAWVTHPEGWLCVGLILYGWRLGLFIFLRDILGWKHFPPSSMGKMKNEPRVVMALTLSFLYALMTLPVLPSSRRAHQGDDEAPFPILACVGTAIAWAGGVLETVVDFHKQLVKEKAKKIAKKEDDAPRFTGPVTGFYSITRHPNSTSEMIFWLGVWLAGLPSYTTASTWVATTIGSITLVTIMCFDGTPRLEKQQHGRYSGIKEYEEWKCRVPHVLIPCIY